MIRGYNEYKVVWYNPLVGEDLLSEHEVGNPHNTHAVYSHVAKLPFPLLCGDGIILTPKLKKSSRVDARLHDVVIKIIDGNLTLLGNIPQRISPYF